MGANSTDPDRLAASLLAHQQQAEAEKRVMSLGMDPNAERLSVLPNPNGSFNPADWTAPEWMHDMAKALTLPGHVMQGGQWSPDNVTDMAMNVGLGGSVASMAAPVPAGSVGMGLGGKLSSGRVGPYIPDEAPKNLRDRYWGFLYDAAGGKDPHRIKITQERVDIAKNLLKDRIETRDAMIPELYSRGTDQSRKAVAFASEAIRAGYDPRIKFPDGPAGSVYVRVGDSGTVRFSDHSAPIDQSTKKMVGGYSETLGRRHYPADLSVAPRDMSYDDAVEWLSKIGK